jgi:peptide chain release factor 1
MDQLPDIFLFQRRLDELDAQMAAPSFMRTRARRPRFPGSSSRWRKLVETHADYERVGRELAEAPALVADPAADPN